VTLVSGNPAVASVPATVTVAAGATSATFPLATPAIATATTVTISAAHNGATTAAQFTVLPPQDSVTVTVAQYDTAKQVLSVEATCTSAFINVYLFVSSTGQLMGALTNAGGGTYKGQFSSPTNPQQITLRSTLGGRATVAVVAN
jgi:hypothetical protein